MWKRIGKHTRLRDDENFTFIGKGVDFKGIIYFDGAVHIDCRLEGEIHTKGTLIIAENAVINASISVGSLICSGKINGNIHAAEKVTLMKPAVLIGDVRPRRSRWSQGRTFMADVSWATTRGSARSTTTSSKCMTSRRTGARYAPKTPSRNPGYRHPWYKRGVGSSVSAAQGSSSSTEVDSRADLLAHLRHEPCIFSGALVF